MTRRTDKISAAFRLSVWVYFALVIAVWALLRICGERWWLATVMLFGPRWVYGLPLILFIPGATLWYRSLLRPLAASALVVVGPIMGLCLPWGRLAATEGATLRVLTCNVKGHNKDNEPLNELIRTATPDIVALQDCWSEAHVAWPEGWHVCQQEELLVASRYPIRAISLTSGKRLGHVWPRANLFHCILTLPQGEIAFCCVHLPSPHYGIAGVVDRRTLLAPSRSGVMDEETDERRQQANLAAEMISEISEPLILAGDFNLPTDSPIYQEAWARYWNAFSSAGLGFGYTEWPQVPLLRFGIRIDHVLSGPNWRPIRCWVGPDVGSDHRPLIADLVWVPSATISE